MASFLLALGCALIAFGPFLTMFTIVIYTKAQLVIVVTTAAFFFLLAALCSGIIWSAFYTIKLDIWLATLIPSVICQFIARCLFVTLYQKVERVIRVCIEEAENQEDTVGESDATQMSRSSSNSKNSGGSRSKGSRRNKDNRNANTETPTTLNSSSTNNDEGTSMLHNGDNNTANTASDNNSNWTAVAKLRLQLNDASCGIAAGVGYSGMHTIMFYGTLLSSEIDNIGILYQTSCPMLPGLLHTAIIAFVFAVLDIFWMLLTFFGIRRRLLYQRGGAFGGVTGNAGINQRAFGSYFGNSRTGGNLALILCLVSHTAASMVTLSSQFKYGCTVSIPLLFGIMGATIYLFWCGISKIYIPPENTDLSISLTASRQLDTPQIGTSRSNESGALGVTPIGENTSLFDADEDDQESSTAEERYAPSPANNNSNRRRSTNRRQVRNHGANPGVSNLSEL